MNRRPEADADAAFAVYGSQSEGTPTHVRGRMAVGTVEDELAHLRQATRGQPGWGRSQRWGLTGQTPSVSHYDFPNDDPTVLGPPYVEDGNVYDLSGGSGQTPNPDNPFWSEVRAGIKRFWARQPLDAPTLTRRPRVSAQLSSVPAARFFNQAGGWAGTGRSWSGAFVPALRPALHQNFNPNMQGAAELHPAINYDPYPSPSSLYPKVV